MGDASKSTFSNDADRKRIEDFIQTEVERFSGKGVASSKPAIYIKLNLDKEFVDSAKTPAAVVKMTTNGEEKGKLSNGDPNIELYTHDQLLWCTYPGPNGHPRGFETTEEHNEHIKIDKKPAGK